MNGFEIVFSDVNFYAALVGILTFGWMVFKFILNARIAPLEKQAELNKYDISTLKTSCEKLKEEHQESKITLGIMNERMTTNFIQIAKDLSEIKNLLTPMQADIKHNAKSIISLEAKKS